MSIGHMPSMEVAIVGEVLALRTDGREQSILPQAKDLSKWAITDGTRQLSSDIPPILREGLSRLGGCWSETCYCLVEVIGGRFHGLRAIGAGSNKRLRQRAGHLALTASATLAAGGLNATYWKSGDAGKSSFEALLDNARELPGMELATQAAIAEMAKRSATGLDGVVQIPLNLRCYYDAWCELLSLEFREQCGEASPYDEDVDTDVLIQQGTCLVGVVIEPSPTGYALTYGDHEGGGDAKKIKAGSSICLSREHPAKDGLPTAFAVLSHSPGRLRIEGTGKEPQDFCVGKWRVDLEPDRVEFGMGVIAGWPLAFFGRTDF